MRVSSALALGVVCGFAVSFASCGAPQGPACGPSTCAGCCDANGECLGGSAVFECGSGGAMCTACQSNELCRAGACERFDGGDYDANFPFARDASINYDAGLFDAGPMPVDAGPPDAGRADAGAPVDAGRPDAGGAVDAGRPDAGASDAGSLDAGPPVSFMNDVAPIFTMYCVGCHASRAVYSNARARVVPGSPFTSLIYQKITGTQSQGAPMPLGGQLSVDDPAATSTIERWILQGALDN